VRCCDAKISIHQIVLSEATGKLLSDPAVAAQSAEGDLAANPAIANLGSIGPDLFFWAPDYEVVDVLYTFYKNYAAVRKICDDIVQPYRDIRDAVVEPFEEAVETLARGDRRSGWWRAGSRSRNRRKFWRHSASGRCQKEPMDSRRSGCGRIAVGTTFGRGASRSSPWRWRGTISRAWRW
jgi:hypothetical protein